MALVVWAKHYMGLSVEHSINSILYSSVVYWNIQYGLLTLRNSLDQNICWSPQCQKNSVCRSDLYVWGVWSLHWCLRQCWIIQQPNMTFLIFKSQFKMISTSTEEPSRSRWEKWRATWDTVKLFLFNCIPPGCVFHIFSLSLWDIKSNPMTICLF